MSIELTEQQELAIATAPELPTRVISPRTQETYVLLRSELYDRISALFEEKPISASEKANRLRQFGQRAGWDDPEMDIYNESTK